MFLVATNVVASRLPERRLTGTPTARANKVSRQNKEYHGKWNKFKRGGGQCKNQNNTHFEM